MLVRMNSDGCEDRFFSTSCDIRDPPCEMKKEEYDDSFNAQGNQVDRLSSSGAGTRGACPAARRHSQ